jgi:hypothetical protein
MYPKTFSVETEVREIDRTKLDFSNFHIFVNFLQMFESLIYPILQLFFKKFA